MTYVWILLYHTILPATGIGMDVYMDVYKTEAECKAVIANRAPNDPATKALWCKRDLL